MPRRQRRRITVRYNAGMLMGTQDVTLHQIRPISFHGQRFVDLTYSAVDSPEKLCSNRAPFEEVYPDPRPGDRAVLHFLMGTITKVEKGNSP